MQSRITTIDKSLQKTDIWLNEIQKNMQWESKATAFKGLRAVLHALRDQLTVEENAHLSAQFSLLIRGLYFEGWQPSKRANRCHKQSDFVDLVAKEFKNDPLLKVRHLIHTVFSSMANHVSKGELQDIRHCLAEDLKSYIDLAQVNDEISYDPDDHQDLLYGG